MTKDLLRAIKKKQDEDHDLLILLNERGKEMIRRLETFDTDITRLENVASNHSKVIVSLNNWRDNYRRTETTRLVIWGLVIGGLTTVVNVALYFVKG